MGRRGYSAEFRRRVVELVAAGRKVAMSPGISGSVSRSSMSGDIGTTSIAVSRRGLSSPEREELAAAKCRITEFETELAIHGRAAELLKEHADPDDGSVPSR